MAYDEDLADRVRVLLAAEPGLTERAMFGGLVFLLDGNMACGVSGTALMVRLPDDAAAAALDEPGGRPFTMGGRPMRRCILVDPPGDLRQWVDRGVRFARTFPPK